MYVVVGLRLCGLGVVCGRWLDRLEFVVVGARDWSTRCVFVVLRVCTGCWFRAVVTGE